MTPPLYKMGVVLLSELSEGIDAFMLFLLVTSLGPTLSFFAGEAAADPAGFFFRASVSALVLAAASCFSCLSSAVSVFLRPLCLFSSVFLFHDL